MSLKQDVFDYVNLARKRPALASDPNTLDALENDALTSFDGAMGALYAPIAPLSWESRTLFLGNSPTSERIQTMIRGPVMVVGAYTWVEVLATNSSSGSVAPTTNSIDCTVDLNVNEYATNAQGTTTPVVGATGQRDGTFVTLAALGVNGGQRLWGWIIKSPTAQLGVTFRWKQGGTIYKDAHVGITWYVRRLDQDGGVSGYTGT